MKVEQNASEIAVKQAQSWVKELDEIAELIGRHFSRSEVRERAITYLRGLMSQVERKNGWQLAEEAGDDTPYATQHLLGRAVWSADEVRDDLSAYVVKYLGDEDGVVVIDETGFMKCGVGTGGIGILRWPCWRLFNSGAGSRRDRGSVEVSKKRGPIPVEAEELLPLTVPEVRRLIWRLVWGDAPTPEHVVKWSRWRRKHQVRAKRSHYKRYLAQYTQLQL